MTIIYFDNLFRMKPEVREEALEQLEKDILFGFEKQGELFESIRDMFYDEEEFDEAWLKQSIEERYQIHQNESRTWQKPTDFDRLAKSFDELIEQKIVCLHNAGHTKSDGIEDCLEVVNELTNLSLDVKGYCYYHSQDLARAVDPEIKILLIGFDSVENNDSVAMEVAREIIMVLEKNGFKTVWPGTVDQRIEIVNIEWRKVPDDEEWGPHRVVQLVTKKDKGKKPFWKFW